MMRIILLFCLSLLPAIAAAQAPVDAQDPKAPPPKVEEPVPAAPPPAIRRANSRSII